MVASDWSDPGLVSCSSSSISDCLHRTADLMPLPRESWDCNVSVAIVIGRAWKYNISITQKTQFYWVHIYTHRKGLQATSWVLLNKLSVIESIYKQIGRACKQHLKYYSMVLSYRVYIYTHRETKSITQQTRCNEVHIYTHTESLHASNTISISQQTQCVLLMSK